jgi:hypothetical protein
MLFSTPEVDGVKIGGFVESPSAVLVTWKSDEGKSRTSLIEVGGIFCEHLLIKGRVTDIIAVPLLKTKRSLYVSRLVKNADEIGDWFRAQGMETVSAPGDMHVTVAYSKSEVDWAGIESYEDDVEVPEGMKRSVEPLGDKGAVVLKFQSPALERRWSEFLKAGATWNHPSYEPHVTLTYKASPGAVFLPYPGPIVLGPERFAEVTDDWMPVEKALESKESVDYSKGMASSHCGICGHFHPPHACAKVAGEIDADMWCKLFVRAAEKADRKSPPKGYPEDRSEYAVPDEYEFPIDAKHIHGAIGYFSEHPFKSAEQKRSAAKRILHAAKKHGVDVSDDSDVARAAHGD